MFLKRAHFVSGNRHKGETMDGRGLLTVVFAPSPSLILLLQISAANIPPLPPPAKLSHSIYCLLACKGLKSGPGICQRNLTRREHFLAVDRTPQECRGATHTCTHVLTPRDPRIHAHTNTHTRNKAGPCEVFPEWTPHSHPPPAFLYRRTLVKEPI